MKRKDVKAANGVGPGSKWSVKQVVYARLIKKARGRKKDGQQAK